MESSIRIAVITVVTTTATVTEQTGDDSGILKAQSTATMAASHSESQHSDSGRVSPLPAQNHVASDEQPSYRPQDQQYIDNQLPSHSEPSEMNDYSPPPGSLRHPPLPFDLNHPPRFGEGVDQLTYQWLMHFNQWLSQRDSFFASEIRVRSRVVRQVRTDEGLALTFGGPQQLMQTLSQRLEAICPELVKSAQAVGIELSRDQLHVEIEVLDDSDPRWSVDSMSDYQKRQLALQAMRQVEEATTSRYVSEHLIALGGQVIYVIPEALQT